MFNLKTKITAIGMLHLTLVIGINRLEYAASLPYSIRYALWLAHWALLAPLGYAPIFIERVAESPGASILSLALNSMLWGAAITWLIRRRGFHCWVRDC
jgi:hypothetical protein